MADALDLGSSPKGCRFNSCYPHQIDFKYILSTGVKTARLGGFPENRQIFRVIRRVGFKNPAKTKFLVWHSAKEKVKIYMRIWRTGVPRKCGGIFGVAVADALDLGSSPKGCRFNSCYPHHLNFKYILPTGVEPARFIGFLKNRQIFRVIVPVIRTT